VKTPPIDVIIIRGFTQSLIEQISRIPSTTLSYSRQFDQQIVNFQAIQWMIAESYTELEAARLPLMNAAFQKEQGRFFARSASMAKYYATEAAERACHHALQMLGGYGYTKEFFIERYYRDVRITSIYEGTNQIQRLIIARDILSKIK